MNQPRTELWWLQRLQVLFEQFGVNALTRQSTRGIRVRRIDLQPGQISTRLQDRELGEGAIEIFFDRLEERQWSAIIDQMSNQAFFAAQMLSEQLPAEIESIFLNTGAPLVPQTIDEVTVQSSFPAEAQPRLLSAIFTALVDLLRGDPWLLLLLRGRQRESILQQLRQSRTEGNIAVARPADVMRQADAPLFYPLMPVQESAEENVSLSAQLERFWGDSRQLRSLHHYIAAPAVELALLRRLGPIAQTGEWQTLHEEMAEIYRNVTESALALAYEVRAEPVNANAA